MASIKKSTNFPAVLTKQMFMNIKGHSSLAKMAQGEPIAFAGNDVFVFSPATDVSVVGEGSAKPAGDGTLATKQIRPVKVVYQARVSDEFVYASEEAQLQYLESFREGFERMIARGFDKMALHGINPATGASSSVIGNNHLDYVVAHYNSGSNEIEYTHGTDVASDKIEEAIATVEDANGLILSNTMRTDLATEVGEDGQRKFPEFAFGNTPERLGTMAVDTNKTAGTDYAVVGDFGAFKWGYAKEIPLEVIEYGNPDGGTYDLKQANEVLLRAEAYIGWAFIDEAAFARVIAPSS